MIRQATQHDLSEIVELYKAGLEELGLTDWKQELLEKKVAQSFILAPCFILVIDGIVKGMAGLTTVVTSHNGVATLADYMFYIDPECRNINSLGGLVEAIKEFAKANNLLVRLEFISKNDEKLKARLLRMNGFEVGGVIGVYNV